MFRLLLGPLALAAALAGLFFVETNGQAVMLAAALMLTVLALTGEALWAEWRGHIGPRVAAGVSGFAFLVWAPAAMLLSWFVPLDLWLLAVTAVYGLARTPMRASATARAWTAAGERFARRREARGRHYRWRVALAALPWMIYLFSLSFLMAGITAYGLALAGGAAGSAESAVLGFLVGTLAVGLGVLISVPSLLALAGLGLAAFVRAPYLRLVLSLRDDDAPPPTGCGASLAIIALDVLLLAIGFVWTGSTLVGTAFPGGGSTASALLLPFVLGALALRVLAGDAHLLPPQAGVIRALGRDPGAFLQLGVAHLGVALWLFAIPTLVAALALLGSLAGDVHPAWIALGGLAWTFVAARLGAATILRLHLHRLELLDALGAEPTGRRPPDAPG